MKVLGLKCCRRKKDCWVNWRLLNKSLELHVVCVEQVLLNVWSNMRFHYNMPTNVDCNICSPSSHLTLHLPINRVVRFPTSSTWCTSTHWLVALTMTSCNTLYSLGWLLTMTALLVSVRVCMCVCVFVVNSRIVFIYSFFLMPPTRYLICLILSRSETSASPWEHRLQRDCLRSLKDSSTLRTQWVSEMILIVKM